MRFFTFFGIASIVIFIFGFFIAYPHIDPYGAYGGVKQFGPLKLGSEIPSGPGDFTFAPINQIPPSTFYVTIVQQDLWCILEDCGSEGALIKRLHGWLQMEKPSVYPDIVEEVGLDLKENKNIKSVVLIGDHKGKIVGIYPRRNIGDLISILKQHPDLISVYE